MKIHDKLKNKRSGTIASITDIFPMYPIDKPDTTGYRLYLNGKDRFIYISYEDLIKKWELLS